MFSPRFPTDILAHCLGYHNQDTDLDPVKIETLMSQDTPGIRRCPAAAGHAIPTSTPYPLPRHEAALVSSKHKRLLLVCDFAISRFYVRGFRVCCVLDDLYYKPWTSCNYCQCHSLRDIWLFRGYVVVPAYNPGTQEDHCESELHRKFQVSLGCRMRSCLNNNNNNNNNKMY